MAASHGNSQHELLTQIGRLYTQETCCDFELHCHEQVLKVHRAILSARSPVMRKALQNDWKEISDGKLTLSQTSPRDGSGTEVSDDPVAVKMMVEFMYKADYEPQPDPYGLVHSADAHAEKSTPTIEERMEQHEITEGQPYTTAHDEHPVAILDKTTPDTTSSSPCSEHGGNAHDGAEYCQEKHNDSSMKSGILELHAKVYALGDKYDIPTLQDRALEKFEEQADLLHWDDDAFCCAITTAFALTTSMDDRLRDVITEILNRRIGPGRVSQTIRNQIYELPDLAYSLWDRNIQLSKGPQCNVCNTVEVTRCSGGSGFNVCNQHFAICRCCPGPRTCDGCSGLGRSAKQRGLFGA